MNNINQSLESETKNITFGSLVSWLFGIFVGVPAIMMLFTKFVTGLLLLIAAVIVFPPTSKLIRCKLKISLSGGLKFALVLVIIIIAGSTLPSDSNSVADTVADVPAEPEKAIEVSAVKLIADYKANEVSADATYKDKLVEIKGIVKDIGKDILDTPYITLSDGQQYSISSFQCMFTKQQETELAAVVKGQSITLQGRVSGAIVGNVIARGCSIVK